MSIRNKQKYYLGQDPYHGIGQAHGLSFSVNDGVALPPFFTEYLQRNIL